MKKMFVRGTVELISETEAWLKIDAPSCGGVEAESGVAFSHGTPVSSWSLGLRTVPSTTGVHRWDPSSPKYLGAHPALSLSY